MAKIFSPPEGFDPPQLNTDNIRGYFDECEEFVESLKKAIKESYGPQCPEAGKEIRFPVGDGYARYIVARLKPVELIHVPVGDCWHFEYVNRLTASDVRKEIKKVEGLRALFGSKKNKETA